MVKESGADRALVASQSSRSVSTKGFDHGELEALAERCEAATGPDRTLDASIWHIAGGYGFQTPRYTASLDAAMTLVPDDGFGSMVRAGDKTVMSVVTKPERGEGRAVTPALALCAAALRARAAT